MVVLEVFGDLKGEITGLSKIGGENCEKAGLGLTNSPATIAIAANIVTLNASLARRIELNWFNLAIELNILVLFMILKFILRSGL